MNFYRILMTVCISWMYLSNVYGGPVDLQGNAIKFEKSAGAEDFRVRLQSSIDKAKELAQKGSLEAARLELEKVDAGSRPSVEVLLSTILMELGQTEASRQVLQKFLIQPGREYEAHLVSAELAINDSRWFDAEAHLEILKQCKMAAYWSPDYQKRMDCISKILRGKIEESREHWIVAEKFYLAAREIDPAVVDIYSSLARTSFRQEKFEECLGYFAEIKKRETSANPPELELARMCRQFQKSSLTEKYYLEVIKLPQDPVRSQGLVEYAGWLLETNQHSKLENLLSQEKVAAEQQLDWDFIQALLLRKQKKFIEAKDLLVKLQLKEPASFNINNQLSLVMIEIPDEALRSRALQLAESNIRNHPNSFEAWSTLGWVQFKLGDLKTAEQNLSKVIQSGGTTADTLNYLAEVKLKKGEVAAARQLQSAAEKLSGLSFYTK